MPPWDCQRGEATAGGEPCPPGATCLKWWGLEGSPIYQWEPLPPSCGCWFGFTQGREWGGGRWPSPAATRPPRRACGGAGARTPQS